MKDRTKINWVCLLVWVLGLMPGCCLLFYISKKIVFVFLPWLYQMSNAIGLEVILTAMTISAIIVSTLNILQKIKEEQKNE